MLALNFMRLFHVAFSNQYDRDVDVTDFYVIWLFRADSVLQLHMV